MAVGYRGTEAGDRRVAEDGAARTTERFFTGAVALAAVALLAGDALITRPASSALAAAAALDAAGARTTPAVTSLSGGGATLGAAGYGYDVAASLTASSAIHAETLFQTPGAAALEGAAAISAAATRAVNPSAALAAVASMRADTLVVLEAFAYLGPVSLTRITGDGDTRVTEDGQPRTVALALSGAVLADATVTSWDGEVRYHDGTGFDADVDFHFHDGVSFVPVERVYVCIAPGEWRRIK